MAQAEQPRHCIECAADIFECMGFVLARDIVFATMNLIGPRIIRELCGRCILLYSDRPRGAGRRKRKWR